MCFEHRIFTYKRTRKKKFLGFGHCFFNYYHKTITNNN
jgi:hypothetical protein